MGTRAPRRPRDTARMPSATRDALLEQGALLFASRGLRGVTTRDLHLAAGARNQSALHYHFGDLGGLVAEILRLHLSQVEARRGVLVERMRARATSPTIHDLVRALAEPMADDLATPVGRAHLRLVAMVNPPEQSYDTPFAAAAARLGTSAPAGGQVAAWLRDALRSLPTPLRVERLAALRIMLIGAFAARAQLLDESPERGGDAANRAFVENLIDMLVAALTAVPSTTTSAALRSARVD